MPTCKKCNEIVGVADIIKDGVCKYCINPNQPEGVIIEDSKIASKKISKKQIIIAGIVLILALYGINRYFSTPSEYVIKELAHSYIYYTPTKDIKVIKSYEKDGKIVEILKIKDRVCEMPMLKVDGVWNAFGINCIGG